MRRIIAQFRRSEFLRHNAIFFVGSGAVSVLNYLYYPLLGRLLDPAGFGEVQTLVTLFTQIAIFLSVLGMLTVNIVANSKSNSKDKNSDEDHGQRTILELEKLALFISFLGLLAAIVCGPILKRFFNFQSALPFIVLAIAVVVSIPATFRTSYLRGKQLFGLNSIEGLISAAAKLAFSALFIVAGFGTTGAIAGLVFAQLVAFVYASAKARQAGFSQSLTTNFFRLPDMRLILPELKFAMLVLTGSLAITVLYSIDIIVVKHYFDAHTAGLYAGIATVARIIFFLTGSIAQVLMPAVKLSNTPQENYQVLRKSAILLAGIGGIGLAVFWLLPGLIIRTLMGGEYDTYASLLPRLSLVIFVVSVINLFMLYYIALRRYAIGVIAILGLIITCSLVGMNHDSLQAVVDSMLQGTLAMAGLLAGWMAYGRFNSRADNNQQV